MEAHATGRVARCVQDGDAGAGDLEGGRVGQLDVRAEPALVLGRPEHEVVRVQSDLGVLGGGDLDGGVDVVVVAVGQDDGHHAPLAHPGQDGLRVVGRVDDQHLVLVADEPDVVLDLPLAAVESEGAGRDDSLDASGHQRTTTERRTPPWCIFSKAASTSVRPIVSDTKPSRSNRPCR